MKYLFFIITSLSLLSISCNSTEPFGEEEVIWQTISSLEGIDIWDTKIFNNEIYVAGKSNDDKGVVYKSSDAINWSLVSPQISDSLNKGVCAIDFLNGNLIIAATGKPIYVLSDNGLRPISERIFTDVREMIVDEKGNILLGTINDYYYRYITSSQIIDIYDSLNTVEGCSRQNAICPIGVAKFLKDPKSKQILIANYYSRHFVTMFENKSINCFPTEGLTQNDKYTGCYDMNFIGDTLFAATHGRIRILVNDRWETYGDSLPKLPNGSIPLTKSITYDPIKENLFAATNYSGVLKWVSGQGWTPVVKGLNSYDGIYEPSNEITYFKGVLLLTFGKSRPNAGSRVGAMVYILH